jgi:dTDP-4-dehydrorhamnose reductase
MKVLIFGGSGYLGSTIQRKLYPEAIAPTSSEVYISDDIAVSRAIAIVHPDLVINAAGFTGRPNIDECEHKPYRTIQCNTEGPIVIAEACRMFKCRLVHLGSGCIYQQNDRPAPFTEEDPPNFFGSMYSRSKIAADGLLGHMPNVLNLRLRMPFDGSWNERNLLVKLSKYPRALDVPNSMTSLDTLLFSIEALVALGAEGTFHVVDDGTSSLFQLAELYQKIVDPNHRFERLELDSLDEVAKAGRSNCVLSNTKLKATIGSLHRWNGVEDAARYALHTMAGSKNAHVGKPVPESTP